MDVHSPADIDEAMIKEFVDGRFSHMSDPNKSEFKDILSTALEIARNEFGMEDL